MKCLPSSNFCLVLKILFLVVEKNRWLHDLLSKVQVMHISLWSRFYSSNFNNYDMTTMSPTLGLCVCVFGQLFCKIWNKNHAQYNLPKRYEGRKECLLLIWKSFFWSLHFASNKFIFASTFILLISCVMMVLKIMELRLGSCY